MNNFIIGLLVVCILLFVVFVLFSDSDALYAGIDNDHDVDTAQQYITRAKYRISKNPIDNYRIGTVYDHMLHDTKSANKYYKKAVSQIVTNPQDQNARFIRDRLQDRAAINRMAEADDNKFDLNEINALEFEIYQLEQIFLDYDAHDNDLQDRRNLQDRKEQPRDAAWTADSQNVHDSNITSELQRNYAQLLAHNTNNQLYVWTPDEISQYLRGSHAQTVAGKKDAGYIGEAVRMLDHIRTTNANITKINADECAFIGNVFAKIYTQPDPDVKQTMTENFVQNLKDCYDRTGKSVCATGRITRTMSSFTNLDKDVPNMGIFKSKQVIKNEAMVKAGNIRNRHYDAAPQDLKKKYDEAANDSETQALEAAMKKDIKTMIYSDYNTMSGDPKFLKNLVAEAVAAV
jgi:menaquinone-dependent protoporphyrinogen IX oxidase